MLRARDPVTLLAAACLVVYAVFVTASALTPIEPRFQRYAEEFISRVNFAVVPIVAALAARGVTWAWSRHVAWRVVVATLVAVAFVTGADGWLSLAGISCGSHSASGILKGTRVSLIEEVSGKIVAAMKSKDTDTLGTLRMLKTALTNREIEKGRALEPAEELQVVGSLVKQRRDSIEQFTKGNRLDLAEKEQREIVVLERLLPPAVSAEDLGAVVDRAVTSTGAASAKDFGKVMKAAMAELAGKTVDGKAVSEAVKKRLG